MLIRDFSYYDQIIVSYSGGKDSTACALLMKEYGIPVEKVWLWHQCVDGRGDTSVKFFDWPSTEGYVTKFSELVGMKLDFQWRHYGFYGELTRQDSLSNDVSFTRNGETTHLPTVGGKASTRLKWPAKTASLNTRWCSAYLKIDVAARALSNHPDLKGKRVLFITGERREESTARSKYKEAELHRCNSKSRLVHHWRPVIDWKEQDVWTVMENNRIMPHPAYFLGFPRLSCRSCIFYSANHWATLNKVAPEVIREIAEIEQELGFTLDNKFTVMELINKGKSLLRQENRPFIKLATTEYVGEIVTDKWILPAGAFGAGGGSI